MAGHGSKLPRKTEAVVAALLTEGTIEQAADKAGVSARSIKTWLQLPEFQAAYLEAGQQLVQNAIGRLQEGTGEAVDTLRTLLACNHMPTRARAALGMLDYAYKGMELLNLAQRVEDLERAVREGKGR